MSIGTESIGAFSIGEESGGTPVPTLPIRKYWLISYTISTPVTALYDISYEILSINRLRQSYDISYSITGESSTLILKSSDYQQYILIGNRQVKFSTLSISGDQSSSQWSFSAEIPERGDFGAISAGDAASYTVLGITFAFEIDGKEMSLESGAESYSISGRTPQAGLDKAEAIQPITNGQAATVMAAAQLAGSAITLSWNTVDWNPPIEEPGQTSPLEFIRGLATAVRATMRWNTNGTLLIVRPEWPVSPWELGTATPALTVPQTGIFTLSDSLEVRANYNAIDIIDGATSSSIAYSWEQTEDGAARIVKLRTSPSPEWIDKLPLLDSGGTHFYAQEQGVRTEEITEEIEIVDGRGRVGKYPQALVSAEWRYEDQGSLTLDEQGNITASAGGNSLLGITYTSRHRQWRAEADVPRIQVFLQGTPAETLSRVTVARPPGNSAAPAITDTILAGIPAMRERGRGELAEYASRRNISLEIPLSGSLPNIGDTVEIGASQAEPEWRGKIVSLSIAIESGVLPTLTVGVERAA